MIQIQNEIRNYYTLKFWQGPRKYIPSDTNYEVHSPTWGDGKPMLLPSAMEVTDLGHDSC
jgi:hypothetical protein